MDDSEPGELLSFADGADVIGTSGDDTLIANGGYGEPDRAPRDFTIDVRSGDDLVELGGHDFGEISAGEGDDTVTSGGGGILTVSLGEGDDYSRIGRSYEVSIDGGDGDDLIRTAGDRVTVDGGDGNDTIYAEGPGANGFSNIIAGGAGDDEIFFEDADGSVDAGSGDDWITVNSLVGLEGLEEYYQDHVIVTTGEGADHIDLTVELSGVDAGLVENRSDLALVETIAVVTDFDAANDSLRVEIQQSAENAGREVDLSLIPPSEAGGAYRLEFDIAANSNSVACTSVIEITSSGPLTLDDIEIVGLDPAAEGGAQSITVASEEETRTIG